MTLTLTLRDAPMSLRARAMSLLLVIAAATLAMAAVAALAISRSHETLRRVQVAQDQAQAITRLGLDANRYSEQIAEVLLLGESQRPDLEQARSELTGSFEYLNRLWAMEAALAAREAQQIDSAELRRLNQMRALYREVDRAAERLFVLRSQGSTVQAQALFRAEIEYRLDRDLQRLIDQAVRDERREMDAAHLAADAFHRNLAISTAAVAAVLLLVGGAAALALGRALSAPIRQLDEGVRALERGELDHRIAYERNDELGRLARRFNAMAAELASQRDLLLKSRDELEGEVQRRTAELAEANRKLIELDEARVRFIGEISHELRTPLTVLRGEAEVALRGRPKSGANYREALEQIAAQAASMGRLTEDLLLLARADADQVRFQPEPADLVDLVRVAVREAEALARGDGARVRLSADPAPLPIEADPARLKQALLILLDNALKYGDLQAEVEASAFLAGPWAEVEIINRASLDRAEAPRLFDRFYRGANSAERARSGVGLGLSIAKWIVERHGGKIGVEPQDGLVRAYIRLPLSRAAERPLPRLAFG
jgi:two-component system, OmpR family, sensor kinase